MGPTSEDQARAQVELIYRAESRRVLATLIRLLGGFEPAEEVLQEAFAAALEQWPKEGVPSNPRAWLISVGRFRGIDAIRRRRRLHEVVEHAESTRPWPPPPAPEPDQVADDHLRLLFTCCRPELPLDVQIAMTLREVCGLTTEEIARAYLARASTIAQRIVRAKQKIREDRLPYEVPALAELPARQAAVRRVIYLVFNEGYSASSGVDRVRAGLCEEAIRLARLLGELLPDPETDGLLALLLLQDARRAARTSATGDLVLLADQDRSLWDPARIAEGTARLERALSGGGHGPYSIQAAIAAVHAESPDAASTDWAQIVALYDALLHHPSPVARLARAIAIGEGQGPAAGLVIVEDLLLHGELADYLPAHSARGELYRKLGRTEEALGAFRRALSLARLEPERRFLAERIARLERGLVAPDAEGPQKSSTPPASMDC